MEEGHLIMTFSELDPNLMVRCNRLKVSGSEDDTGHALEETTSVQVGNEITCHLGREDQKELEDDPTVNPEVGEAFLAVDPGSGILFQSKEYVTNAWVQVAFSNEEVVANNLHQLGIRRNRLRRATGVQVIDFTEFDLDSGQVVIVFSDDIDQGSVNLTEITFQNDYNNPSANYTLQFTTCDSSCVDSTNASILRFQIAMSDLNAIKSIPNLCSEATNCVPTHTVGLLTGSNGTAVEPYNPAVTDPYDNFAFIADTTRPNLMAFTLNLSTEQLFLTFDEPVNGGSFVAGTILLQNDSSGSESVTLMGATATSSATEVTVSLGSAASRMKMNTFLGTSINNTFLHLTENSITDLSRNMIAATVLQASNVFADTTPPDVTRFVLSLDTNEVILTFSEPINADTLNTSLFILSRDGTVLDIPLDGSTLGTSTGIVLSLAILLSPEAITSLKTNDAIGTNTSNSFIVIHPDAFFDSSEVGNLNVSQGAADVVEDSSEARLVSWSIDLDASIISLTFDDAVMAGPLFPFGISLSQTGMEEDYPLTNSTIVSPGMAAAVQSILLSEFDLMSIKAMIDDGLFSEMNSSYILIRSATFSDLRNEGNIAVTVLSLNQADVYIADTGTPSLSSYTLDLNLGMLHLTFDEPMDPTRFNFSGFTLQSDSTNTSISVALSGGMPMAMDGLQTEWTVSLLANDLNRLKGISSLATNVSNTFITISTGGASDTSGNAIMEVGPQPAVGVTPDSTAPRLSSFTLDLNLGTLMLTFDETVLLSFFTFDVNITNDGMAPTSFVIPTLTGAATRPQFDVIVVPLSVQTQIQLKEDTTLATMDGNTFILAPNGIVMDTSMNLYVDSGLAVSGVVVEDATDPGLITFTVNLADDSLRLTFDEPLNVSETDLSGFTLHNDRSTSTVIANVTSTRALEQRCLEFGDNCVLFIYFTTDVSVVFRNTPGFGTDSTNTFLRYEENTVFDNNENGIQASITSAAEVVEDTSGPELDTFDLDINTGILTLRYPEVVNVTVFDPTSITLQSSSNGTGARVTLTGGMLVNVTNLADTVSIRLDNADLNNIKAQVSLATNSNNAFLSLQSSVLIDAYGNEVVEIPTTSAVMVSTFTGDATAPQITEFELRPGPNRSLILAVIYDETVMASSVNPMAFTLYSSSNSTAGVTIDGSVAATDSDVIEITLPSEVSDQIRANYPLGVNVSFAFLEAAAASAQDMVGLNASASVRIQASNISADLIPPEIIEFTLDLDMGTLIITFNDNIDATTFDTSGLTLQSDRASAASSHRLTANDGIVVVNDALTITLSQDDLDAIKLDTFLAVSDTTVFLATTDIGIEDTAGNMAIQISVNDSLSGTLISDATQPNLVMFDLDLNANLLYLTFDEPVDASTYNGIGVFLADSAGSSPTEAVLTDSIPLNLTANGRVQVIQLMTDDVGRIADSNTVARSNTSTYIYIFNNGIRDLSGNAVFLVQPIFAIPVTVFTPDETPPTIRQFRLDLDSGQYTVTFSEYVTGGTGSVHDFTLLDSNVSATHIFPLATDLGSVNGGFRTRSLGADTNMLKQLGLCLQDDGNCFVSVSPGIVQDFTGRENAEVPRSNPLPVTVSPDSTPPTLTDFFLFNLMEGYFEIGFNEIVNASTFNGSYVLFQSLNEANPFRSIPLTGGVVEDGLVTRMRVNLTAEDLSSIKGEAFVCSRRYQCYIAVQAGTVLDVSGNPLDGTTGGNAIIAESFILDEIGPVLENYTLDLNSGVVILTFSEAVDSTTLDAAAATFQSQSVFDPSITLTVNLTGGNPNPRRSDVLMLYLNDADLDNLKITDGLATMIGNTFLSFTSLFVSDTAHEDPGPNVVQPILSSSALQATTLRDDTTPPQLSEFQLDLTQETLILTFDEPIRISSIQNISFFTIFSANSSNAEVQPLTGGTVLSQVVGSRVVPIQLVTSDIENLKLNEQIGTEPDNTFLSIAANAVSDMSGNVNDEVIRVQASQFVPDSSRPMLLNFTLSQVSGELQLFFDDVINIASFQPSALRLQSNIRRLLNDDTTYYTLQSSTVLNSNNSHALTIRLSDEDWYEIKRRRSLARDVPTTWITMQAFAFDDVEGVDVLAITDGKALQAFAVVPDDIEPNVRHFDIDMANGILNITFDDFIDEMTVIFMRIYIQNGAPAAPPAARVQLTGGEVQVAEDRYTITILLSKTDLNSIQLRDDLATSENNTFLSVDSGAAQDYDQNELTAIGDGAALNVRNFINDSSLVALESFSLDLNTGVLSLTISEIVRTDTLDLAAVTIQGRRNVTLPNATLAYTLTGNMSVATDSTDPSIVNIMLTMADLNAIKGLRNVASSRTNTYLSLGRTFVEDQSGNPTVAILSTSAQLVSVFVADTTNPVLVNFTIDLNSGFIALNFDEAVDPTTFAADDVQLSIGQSFSLYMPYNLTGGSYLQGPTLSVIVNLTYADLNEVKRIIGEAMRPLFPTREVLVSLPDGYIDDMSGNPATRQTELPAVFVPDTSPPILEAFTLDLDSGNLILTFSETVQGASLMLGSFTLLNQADATSATARISFPRSFALDVGPIQNVTLNKDDFTAVQLQSDLGTTAENTYLVFTNNSVRDTSENEIVEIGMGIQGTVIADDTRPILEDFDLNMGTGILTLVFSEAVDTAVFDVELIAFSAGNGSINSYMLTSGSMLLSGNNHTLDIQLSVADSNSLKLDNSLATSTNDTFISFTRFLVRDVFDNPIEEVPINEAKQVRTFTPDMVGPILSSYTLDVNRGLLLLTFDEIVNDTTLNLALATVLQAPSSSVQRQLTGDSNQVQPDSELTVVTATLAPNDIDYIKVLDLGLNPNNTYLTVETDVIQDIFGNPAEPRSAIAADNVIDDTTRPILTSFDFDMDSGTIVLSFDEAIDYEQGFTISDFQWLNDVMNNGNSTTIEDSEARVFIDEMNDPLPRRNIYIFMNNTELNVFKQQFICHDNLTCFAQFPATAAVDYAGNRVNPRLVLLEGGPLAVNDITQDTTAPRLIEFTHFDLDTGLVTLSFTETVNIASVNFSFGSLANRFDDTIDIAIIPLTGGAPLNADNDDFLHFQLAEADVFSIKSVTTVCRSDLRCWFRLTNMFLVDMFGNDIDLHQAIPFNESFYARNYSDDATMPELLRYSLDMNTGRISLTFDEPVDHTTLQPNQLTLQDRETATVLVNLDLGGTRLAQGFSDVMEVEIDSANVINVKAERRVATSMYNTYLSFSNLLITDTSSFLGGSGNPVVARNVSNGLQVSVFVNDTTPPQLQQFSLLDVDEGRLRFSFDEPVANETFDPSGFHLQSMMSGGSNLTLSGGQLVYVVGTELQEVEITLNAIDLRDLKLTRDLGTRTTDSFTFIDGRAIADVSGNMAMGISSLLALRVNSYLGDETSPSLLNFTLDLNTGGLSLTFDDVMDGGSLDARDIAFQSSYNDSSIQYMLMGPSSLGPGRDGYVIEFNLTLQDLNGLKAIRGLANSVSDTFITMSATAILDVANLQVISVTDVRALQAAFVTPDTKRPELQMFTFNLANGAMILSFTEAIEPLTVLVQEIALQNTSNSSAEPSVSHTLQSFTLNTDVPSSEITFTLSQLDINTIKALATLGTSENDTFLAFSNTAFADPFGNEIVPISSEEAFRASPFVADTIRPVLYSYSFDLNTGIMILNFSESIQVNTFNVTGITVRSSRGVSATLFPLTGGEFLVDSGALLPLRLNDSDLNSIKAMTDLAISQGTTFLTFDVDTFADTAGQVGTAVGPNEAQQPTEFISDTNSPAILTFDFDLGMGLLTLVFNETVDPRTFDPTGLMLQNAPQLPVHSRRISGGSTTSSLGTDVVVQLLQEDLDTIKSSVGFATAEGDTYIAALATTINDTSGNPLVEVATSGGIIARTFVSDSVPPELRTFTLDLNTGSLTLIFTERVRAEDVMVPFFALHDHPVMSVDSITLASNLLTPSTGYTANVTIAVDNSVLNAIKASQTLAVNQMNTYMTIQSNAARDIAGNEMQEVLLGNTVLGNITDDISSPVLQEFDFILVEEPLMIVLYFDETIDPSSLTLDQFTLTDGMSIISQLNGSFDMVYSNAITVNVSADVLDAVRLAAAADPNLPFFINVAADAVRDSSGNPIQVQTNVTTRMRNADLAPPRLQSVILDLNSGSLSLSFTADVLRNETLMPNFLMLSNSQSAPTDNLTLTNAVASVSGASMIEVILSTVSLNYLQRNPSFGTNSDNTFLFHADMLVCDQALNCARQLVEAMALSVLVLPDRTRPMLQYYNLYGTTGVIELCFNEPVNTTATDGREIYLQDAVDYLSGQSIISLEPLLEIEYRPNGELDCVQYNITRFFTDVRALPNLATNYGNTFLSLTSGFIQDTAGLFIEEVRRRDGLAVGTLFADSARPMMTSAEFNLTNGELTMFFSKAVIASSFNSSLLSFLNASDSSQIYTPLSAFLSTTENSVAISVVLRTEDLNTIKSLELCELSANCLLSFPDALAVDTNGSAVFGRPASNPLPVTVLADVAGPVVLEFVALSFIDSSLSLIFNEPLGDMLDFTQLTLQNFFEDPTAQVTLGNQGSFTVDGSTVTLQLDGGDTGDVQLEGNLCTNRQNCFVTLGPGFAQDLAGNPSEPAVTGIVAGNVSLDASNPELNGFSLDLNTGLLTLIFSEPVLGDGLNVRGLTIQAARSVATMNTQLYYQLTSAELNSTAVDAELRFLLSSTDLNILKTLPFANNVNNTYLTILAGSVIDTTGNQIQGIGMSDALMASDVIPDNAPPKVIQFVFDANDDLIILTFDELVQLSSFNVSGIVLDSEPSPTSSSLQLSNGTIANLELAMSSVVIINLDQADVSTIKLSSDLVTSMNDTYISLLEGTVLDTVNNPNNDTTLRQVDIFIADSMRPELVDFSLDIQAGTLVLTFNDVVNASTFDASAIAIQSSLWAQVGEVVPLTNNSSSASASGYEISVQLSVEDHLALRDNRQVAISADTTWLTMQAFAIDDVFGLDVLAITDGKALNVGRFVPDVDPPVLEEVVLDLNSGAIRMRFSDLMAAESLLTGRITLHNFLLSGGQTTRLEDGRTVELALSSTNFDHLVLASGANFTGSILFSAEQGYVTDLSDNAADSARINVSQVFEDETGPVVQSYALNMNDGTLTATLSEPGLASSFTPQYITIQGAENITGLVGLRYTLQTSTVLMGNSRRLVIALSNEDLNALKEDMSLATGQHDTFLAISGAALTDIFGNPVQNISSEAALQVSTFIRDTDPPSLTSFDLDLNRGAILLTFSETVIVEDIMGFSIQDAASPSISVPLSSGNISSEPSSIHIIALAEEDTTQLQLQAGVAISNDTTFLSIMSGAVVDTSGSSIASIITGIRVRLFTADTMPPTLTFYSLDLDSGVLNLTFSEVINVGTFNGSLFRFSAGGSSVAITESLPAADNSATLYIELLYNDLNMIKMHVSQVGVVILEHDYGAVQDMAGNHIGNRTTGLSPQLFSPDVTRPTVVTFNLDTSQSLIELVFDEFVSNTFDVTSVMLVSEATTDPEAQIFGLTMGSTATSSGAQVNIRISVSDQLALASSSPIASSNITTFLVLLSQAAEDLAGNPSVPVRQPNPLPVNNFTPDSRRPGLLAFHLDFNVGELTLVFDEIVSGRLPTNPGGITLHSSRLPDSLSYTLTSGSTGDVFDDNITNFVVSLSADDQNTLTAIRDLAEDTNTTFITIDDTVIRDASNNPAMSISLEYAVAVSMFIPDSNSPSLEGFSFDLDQGRVTLSFNETIEPLSVQPAGVILLRDGVIIAPRVALMGEGISDQLGFEVTIQLTENVRNELKSLDICTLTTNCVISITEMAINDTFGNPVVPVAPTQSIRVSGLTPDETDPSLQVFAEFDLNQGLLTLNFSETVNISSFRLKELILQDYFGDSSALESVYSLTGGTIVTRDHSDMVIIQLSDSDLNAIKVDEELCTAQDNCWIKFSSLLVQDIAERNVTPIRNQTLANFNAFHAPAVFIPDTTRPNLTMFSINLSAGTVSLTFDETVAADTLNPSDLFLQNAPDSNSSVNLIGFTRPPGFANGVQVTFGILPSVLTEIKANLDLATDASSTWFFFTPGLIMDTSNNRVFPRNNVSTVLMAGNFTPDAEPPTMVNFVEFHFTSRTFTLEFSEPVNELAVNFSGITFTAAPVSGSSNYTLTSGRVISTNVDRTQITFQLTADDIKGIKLMYANLATANTDTWITLTADSFQDTAGNPITEVAVDNAIQVTSYESRCKPASIA